MKQIKDRGTNLILMVLCLTILMKVKGLSSAEKKVKDRSY